MCIKEKIFLSNSNKNLMILLVLQNISGKWKLNGKLKKKTERPHIRRAFEGLRKPTETTRSSGWEVTAGGRDTKAIVVDPSGVV